MKNAEHTNKFIIAEQPGSDNGENDLTEEMNAVQKEFGGVSFDLFEGKGSAKPDAFSEEECHGIEADDESSSDRRSRENRGDIKLSRKSTGRKKGDGARSDNEDESSYFHVRLRIDSKTRRRLVLLKSFFDSRGESFGEFLNDGMSSLVNRRFDRERDEIFKMFSGS